MESIGDESGRLKVGKRARRENRNKENIRESEGEIMGRNKELWMNS